MNRPQLNSELIYAYPPKPAEPKVVKTDVCIYGGISGAVAAAMQVVRMGKRAVIIEPGKHLGGLSSGGLGATDIGNKGAIGGISLDFYRALGKHYGNAANWTFEPGVAEGIFDRWVKEHNVPVYFQQRLAAVRKQGGRIVQIEMESGQVFEAPIFIDTTYEGDLLAAAGVSFHVGREANSTYDEVYNGIQFGHPNHNFRTAVDPYVTPGDPTSGVLWGVSVEPYGHEGDGDHRVQAYNFRMCLTNVPGNRLPFPKPLDYDERRYELMRRYIATGIFDALHLTTHMPNGKTDTNNWGGFSTDNIGRNYAWPCGSTAQRERIFQDHVNYQAGLMWFLCNDPRLPAHVREQASQWGLPKDEYVATGGWTHQLYVREARRMISDYVMTERECVGQAVPADSVGMAAYGMDSHNCQRIIKGRRAMNEGNVEIACPSPYPISYKSIVPRESECSNLLVSTCLSSSHIAYGSIRMEPVFMVLGQSAGTAAVMAIEQNVAVQKVDYPTLRARLLADSQVLEWTAEIAAAQAAAKGR